MQRNENGLKFTSFLSTLSRKDKARVDRGRHATRAACQDVPCAPRHRAARGELKKKSQHGAYPFPSRHAAASPRPNGSSSSCPQESCARCGKRQIGGPAASQRLRRQPNNAALSAAAALAARRQPLTGSTEEQKEKTFSRSRIVNHIRAWNIITNYENHELSWLRLGWNLITIQRRERKITRTNLDGLRFFCFVFVSL